MTKRLSGTPLGGSNFVRLVYLDEAGISNLEHEPIMTVAGVVVDGDKQWKTVESHLDGIVAKYLPGLDGQNFAFHAYELFSGVKFFDKKSWPLEQRLEILDALVDIPRKFDLPICLCSVDRKAISESLKDPTIPARLEISIHATAFFFCVIQVEMLLRATTKDEVAMLIAEDREQVRKMLKSSHSHFRGKPDERVRNLLAESAEELAPYDKLLPFERVIDTVHFAQKRDSTLLQVADLCAFAIKRHMMKKPHADRLFDRLKGQFILGPKATWFGPTVHDAASAGLSS